MDFGFLFRGALIGLAIAAPVGPIGVLCIRRTLRDGRTAGFVSGLGAASADLVYGAMAALGLRAVAEVLVGASFWLRLVGGLFLLYLGVRTLLERPAERPAVASGRGLAEAYASTFLLTITNPLTILSFAAVFAGLGGAGSGGGIAEALLLMAGVFLGSALWWLALSWGVSLLRTRVTPQGLRWVNVVSGLVILGFGAAALASL